MWHSRHCVDKISPICLSIIRCPYNDVFSLSEIKYNSNKDKNYKNYNTRNKETKKQCTARISTETFHGKKFTIGACYISFYEMQKLLANK